MATTFIGICNQKGGCGKTTFSIILASYLHYEMGKRVIFIDADELQHSAHKQREMEKKTIDSDPELKEYVSRLDVYPIITCTLEQTIGNMEEIDAQGAYDVCVVDLPGSLSNRTCVNIISVLDLLFVPVDIDLRAAKIAYDFGYNVVEHIVKDPECMLKRAYFFLNKHNKAESQVGFECIKNNFEQSDLQLLQTAVWQRSCLKSIEICSTFWQYDALKAKNTNIPEFIEEMVEKITWK